MKKLRLAGIEKLKLVALSFKAVFALVGASLVLTEDHPYLALSSLAIGAASNEIASFIKEKENSSTIESLKKKR